MFGKLLWKDIPFHEPIIVITYASIIFISIILAGFITYFKKWKYLWKEWFTTLDHKKIAIMYIILAFVMLFRGFVDAIMMRIQQYLASLNHPSGFLPPNHYDQIFTAHGVIMIFFVAMPLIIGLMNFVVPLQIGARDLAFPFLNNLSFWMTVSAVILINLSLGIGEFAKTGWLAYPPLSEMQFSPSVGVDYWIWCLQIAGIGTTLTAINFLVTILKMRAPGMTMFKIPVFTWTVLCSNLLIIASFPVLTITLLLLTLDRYLGFHFFTNDMGGNMMMYVNLIWIWGHPEVYILVLPAFGIFSEIVSTFSKKSLFGYYSLVWATLSITILSFIVWLHHFFTMGAGANVNAFFGITTMIIAIPTGVKIFNWLFTMYQGKIYFHSCMFWTIGFLITFSIGGMAGVLLSLPPADFVLHNSLFLVAHFHNVIIGGVVFGCFAGITYWFPKAFGFVLNETWGKIAFLFWVIGFCFAFIPLYFLGFMGMTRRLSQNIDYNFHTLLSIACIGVFFIFLGVCSQVIQFVISIKNRKNNLDVTGDPWDGRTLEWSISSPAPIYNFFIIPKVKSRDAFWKQKQKEKLNLNKIKKKIIYKDLYIPKNSFYGIIISLFTTIFGFSAVWHIWWLFCFSFISIFFIFLYKSFQIERKYCIKKEKIKKIEDIYYKNLIK
ncbi:MAG: cytochrome o ubiquinol oxidase subunit I [Buchnera aphidicola (Periphyllus lyropictus)]|uniref:cytochrome o ubiquinol oxidase subunit I n=1 Tax=Buchnera aphidicola TaxID=9 RepID=UPI001EB8E3E9|nr:cytochrome o ubiquinol oxidase subunit I [Buchnera aphidicola]NIH16520.1 cytochrome o ubiquinol oxidase subunit I [Buchnera aphidicola (Periphyllus lyropictus)]USS94804.1 cytochrome o ubiquinol oxidase subunit I [Buchnera aphidicola (Periphyllus lyropictus)]